MEYGIVQVPAAPVRRRPGHAREMVNQLLFGETVKVLRERRENWVKIRSLHDHYEGWMTSNMLAPIDAKNAKTRSIYAASGLLNEIRVGEQTMHLPFGASLPFFDQGKGLLGETAYTYSGFYLNRDESRATASQLEALARPWLNAPYLWGGRTPLGVDCSGFVQVLFKMTGIDLPRDTWQQAQDGRSVKKFSDAAAGDLVFFDRDEDIVHVGMLIDKDHVIHSSGKVRIDVIDRKGLVDAETGKYGVRLRAIRRLLEN